MAHGRQRKGTRQPVSLLILEGETEEVFYSLIRDRYLQQMRVELKPLKGRGNVNKDILSKVYQYCYDNRTDLVRVYCCVDSEAQKRSATPLDLQLLSEKIKTGSMAAVLSINQILADPDIESWFFYDIAGIYKFLRAKQTQRNVKKYRDPRKFSKKHLQELFRRFGKEYLPGKKTANFINHLNLEKVVSNCPELQKGIELIRTQSRDLVNHLFST